MGNDCEINRDGSGETRIYPTECGLADRMKRDNQFSFLNRYILRVILQRMTRLMKETELHSTRSLYLRRISTIDDQRQETGKLLDEISRHYILLSKSDYGATI